MNKTSPVPAITRPVVILGLVSLFTDMASEMLYPVMPIFITSIGASMEVVGLLEGAAEATASLLKGYFGALSDRLGKRRLFVVLGYGLSALSKPIPGLVPRLWAVVAARLTDRVGKATRTAPRDALLAAYAPPGARGAVFGFHRAMDTIGAVIGPSVALLFLAFFPGAYRPLFLIAFVPSIAAVLCTLAVREEEPPARPRDDAAKPGLRAAWLGGGAAFHRLLIGFTVFSLANSSDVFLIMKARSVGFSDSLAIGGYILYNIVFAAAAFPLGRMADRWGKKRSLLLGLALFAVVYLGFAAAGRLSVVWTLFLLYGVYAALNEGVIKAWVTDLVQPELRGSSFGLLTMLMSVSAFIASAAGGYLWVHVGTAAPFYLGAGGAVVGGLIIAGCRETRPA